MKKMFLAVLIAGFIVGCATPSSREAQRIYNVNPQQVIVFTDKVDFETVREALKCGITLYVPISVFADVEKHQDQKADAKADISPTVDVTP